MPRPAGCVEAGVASTSPAITVFGPNVVVKAHMSGSTLSSSALDERRRRILFRAWRRGVREVDLVMGQFADMYLPAMSEAEVDEFERLLDVPDPEILAWITGGEAIPTPYDTPLFARLVKAPPEALKRGKRA
jgi:antitoxin CptB